MAKNDKKREQYLKEYPVLLFMIISALRNTLFKAFCS